MTQMDDKTASILIVDDIIDNLKVLSTTLEQQNYKVRCAKNGFMALQAARKIFPDLILLDIQMPDLNGYEVCQRLKADPQTRHIPVIFLSALDDVLDKQKAFAVGGVDYITKPFEVEEVLARVATHLELQNVRQFLEEQVKKRTIELTKALKQADAANIAKSQFIANMSHELRTPLSAIIGYSEILEEESKDLDIEKEQIFLPDLEKIHSSAHHLLEIINNILDLSKIEAGKMELYLEKAEISAILEEVVGIIQPLVHQNLNTLIVEYPKRSITLYTDVFKVRQSLLNLLSNANKFTTVGEITLSVKCDRRNQQDYIYFQVKDNGIGITETEMKKLFTAFGQVDSSISRKYGGTGLGLILTQEFCQMMGGEIMVESTPGKGSCFTIKLPAIVDLPED